MSFMMLINAFQLRVSPGSSVACARVDESGGGDTVTPGALGIYHFTAVLALSVWHVDMSTAVVFAIGAHAISIALHIVFGISCAWSEGIGVWRLTSLAQTAD
jgi:hypothetical protein